MHAIFLAIESDNKLLICSSARTWSLALQKWKLTSLLVSLLRHITFNTLRRMDWRKQFAGDQLGIYYTWIWQIERKARTNYRKHKHAYNSKWGGKRERLRVEGKKMRKKGREIRGKRGDKNGTSPSKNPNFSS